MIKSPLRWPGGKTRTAKQIFALIPKDTDEFLSPFFGGGWVELYVASHGIQVFGGDIDLNLVAFWQAALEDAEALSEQVYQHYFPLTKRHFNKIKAQLKNGVPEVDAAAKFYACNRASFNGAGIYGGFSPAHPRFTKKSIENLANFKADNVKMNLLDYKGFITRYHSNYDNNYMYLDPPYMIESELYAEHKSFDHDELAARLRGLKRWMLSYNDCPYIRDLYAGHLIVKPEWAAGMNKSKKTNELFIFSKDRQSL